MCPLYFLVVFCYTKHAQTTLGEEQNTNDEDETSIAGIGGSDSTLLSGRNRNARLRRGNRKGSICCPV